MKSFRVLRGPAYIHLFSNSFLHLVSTLHIGWFVNQRHGSVVLKIQIKLKCQGKILMNGLFSVYHSSKTTEGLARLIGCALFISADV